MSAQRTQQPVKRAQRQQQRKKVPVKPVVQAPKAGMQRKKRNQAPKKLLMTVQNDARSVQTVNAQPTVTIAMTLSPGALFGVVQQYLSAALSRGFLAVSSAGDPYYAAVYMVNVLLAFARGTVPQASTVPKWLLHLGHALAPKTVPFGTGFVRYAFNTDDFGVQYVPASKVVIGPTVYGYEYLLWGIGAGNVDFFPTAVAPSMYTDTLGFKAWSLLTTFMTDTRNPNTLMVPSTSHSIYETNVSAYTFVQEGRGLGAGSTPSLAQVQGLEVPIRTPCLGTFVGAALGGIPATRYAKFSQTWSGDSMLTSLLFNALLQSPKSLSFRKNPRLKYIDFLEFLDVMALYVSALQTQAINTPGAAVSIPPANLICPLSLQELGLLLRNEMMTIFSDSQSAVQASYPRYPLAGTDNEFVPFVMSSTTVPLQGTAMKLPIYVVENLKCLKGRPLRKIGKDGKKKFLSMSLPVIGQYHEDLLVQADYKYPDPNGGFLPSFTTLSNVMKRRRRESKEGTGVFVPEVEAPISYVDGSSGANYVFINDVTRLTTLAQLWNNWLTQLSTYSVALSVLSSDYGPSALCSIGATRHWVLPTPGYQHRVADVQDDRLTQISVSSVYNDKQAIVTTTYDPMVDGVVKMALNLWILPQNWAKSGPETNQTFYTAMQIIDDEPFSIPSTSGESGAVMSSLHSTYAASMVKGVASDKPVLEEFLLNCEKTGHGGILSSLLAEAAGKFLGPAVGDVAKTVSNMLPL
jgi:hypothetical protein